MFDFVSGDSTTPGGKFRLDRGSLILVEGVSFELLIFEFQPVKNVFSVLHVHMVSLMSHSNPISIALL